MSKETGTLEEWREMASEALDAAEYWKEETAVARTERDILRAALLAIRDRITPSTAYPETVAWVQATVDGAVKE